jgi:hypothetical protein
MSSQWNAKSKALTVTTRGRLLERSSILPVSSTSKAIDFFSRSIVSVGQSSLEAIGLVALFLLPLILLSACGGGGGSTPSVNPSPITNSGIAHGDSLTIRGSNFGAKTNNNSGNFSYFGKQHLVARFTDFDNAISATPVQNTKAGWQSLLDGIYPIMTSTDFNTSASASGATLEMRGGATHSGRWLKRQITQQIRDAYPTNYRLRNWNLWETNTYHPQMYMSCYVNFSAVENPGKFLRFYWNHTSVLNDNVWTAKEKNIFITRAEGGNQGLPLLYDDAPNLQLNSGWIRYEILADFEKDRISFFADGKLLKDVSRNYNGEMSGWLGTGGWLNYFLLANTIDTNGEAGEFLGHAMPYLDFSFKRIELADSADWSTKTKAVVQVPTRWDDKEIDIVVNQGDFADLKNKHLFLLEGAQATYLRALQ